MTSLLDIIKWETAFFWCALAATVCVAALMPSFFKIRFFNGLFAAQVTLILNAIPIISGLETGSLSVALGVHFYVIELLYLAMIYAVYTRMLRQREQVMVALVRFFNSRYVPLLISVIGMIAVFDYLSIPSDGSSRIAHTTAGWYTAIRPVIMIAAPLSYIGVFVLRLDRRRRSMSIVLLLCVIAGSISSGSKAGFVFGLLFGFLSLRDLSPARTERLRHGNTIKMALIVGLMAVVALSRLGVSTQDFVDRILLTGDATMMTYFSERPTAACERVSTFASMHRGFARLLGDASAMDVDTLFGFSLMIEAVGVNSFTGPNARISSYALCNFPNVQILLLLFCLVVYFTLMVMLFRKSLRRPLLLAIYYPFIQASLYNSSQDFHLVMQATTYFIVFLLSTFVLGSVGRRYARAQKQGF